MDPDSEFRRTYITAPHLRNYNLRLNTSTSILGMLMEVNQIPYDLAISILNLAKPTGLGRLKMRKRKRYDEATQTFK